MIQNWLVTGCSSGLGRAIAGAALARGHRVTMTARAVSALDDVVASACRTCGEGVRDRAAAVEVDVRDGGQIRAAVQRASDRFGGLDVVVSNAGAGLIGALEECSDEQIDECLTVNLRSHVHLFRAALAVMRPRRRGHLFAISAVAAQANHEGFAAYGAAKAGLEAMCEAVAVETAPLGIKVTIVQPGPTRTDFASRSLVAATTVIEEYRQTSGKFAALLAATRGKQPGNPTRVAELLVDVAAEINPPLRLTLGRYATQRLRKKLDTMKAELDTWEARSAATDGFPVEPIRA